MKFTTCTTVMAVAAMAPMVMGAPVQKCGAYRNMNAEDELMEPTSSSTMVRSNPGSAHMASMNWNDVQEQPSFVDKYEKYDAMDDGAMDEFNGDEEEFDETVRPSSSSSLYKRSAEMEENVDEQEDEEVAEVDQELDQEAADEDDQEDSDDQVPVLAKRSVEANVDLDEQEVDKLEQ